MSAKQSYSPYDQTGDNSSPCDTAGVRPFDFLILFPSAAAQAGQIYRQYQQTQSQTHGRNTGQEDQRLPNRVKQTWSRWSNQTGSGKALNVDSSDFSDAEQDKFD